MRYGSVRVSPVPGKRPGEWGDAAGAVRRVLEELQDGIALRVTEREFPHASASPRTPPRTSSASSGAESGGGGSGWPSCHWATNRAHSASMSSMILPSPWFFSYHRAHDLTFVDVRIPSGSSLT